MTWNIRGALKALWQDESDQETTQKTEAECFEDLKAVKNLKLELTAILKRAGNRTIDNELIHVLEETPHGSIIVQVGEDKTFYLDAVGYSTGFVLSAPVSNDPQAMKCSVYMFEAAESMLGGWIGQFLDNNLAKEIDKPLERHYLRGSNQATPCMRQFYMK